MTAPSLTPVQLEQLRRFSTCLIASAIESFQVRLPNTGFSDSTIRCIFEDLPPIVGYAATARIRTADPPMEGGGYIYDRTDWWKEILAVPAPRIVIIQDVDSQPGLGAFVGEVHANILQALGCVGLITNGAVRDLNVIQGSGFQCSLAMSPSHMPMPTYLISAVRLTWPACIFAPEICFTPTVTAFSRYQRKLPIEFHPWPLR